MHVQTTQTEAYSITTAMMTYVADVLNDERDVSAGQRRCGTGGGVDGGGDGGSGILGAACSWRRSTLGDGAELQ